LEIELIAARSASDRMRPATPLRDERRHEAGITLVEMLVVVVIIGLMVGISVPAFQAGLPSIRLRGASSAVAQFLAEARNQTERGQAAVLLTIDPAAGRLSYRSVNGDSESETSLPQGVEIAAIAPVPVGTPTAGAVPAREFLLYPSAAVPLLVVELRNERGAGKAIRLDPFTAMPLVTDLPPPRAR
jgi:Tfp pilus assembly protein PilE